MIVDDDPDQLDLFRLTAERSRLFWRVATAEDGGVALEQIRRWTEELPRFVPQIVLTDLKMPGMGGVAFAEAIRRDPTLPPIHLVAMSNSDYAPDVEAAFSAGFEAFVRKPGDYGRLKELFQSLPAQCGLQVRGPEAGHEDTGFQAQLPAWSA